LAATSEELSGQAEQLQQSVGFFSAGAEAAGAARRGTSEAKASAERRAPNSPMRAGARNAPPALRKAATHAAGTGTNGNFRPF
ncbi:MAG: hypothetical protein KGM91_27365, partial [Burkholderiales bacterium]|nr:hypothetical protein [Burkholderiales bacterium]